MSLLRGAYDRLMHSVLVERLLTVIRYRTGLGHEVEALISRVEHLEAALSRCDDNVPSNEDAPTTSTLSRERPPLSATHDFAESDIETCERVRPYTLTSVERVFALVRAVEYVVHSSVPGAFVECGVWKGGSMMAAALTLLRLGVRDRELYLFDTFEGMSAPGPLDVRNPDGIRAAPGTYLTLEDAPLDQVRGAVLGTGYPSGRVHFVKGRVEDTIPTKAPAGIALLRLDTDWYESTLHELTHLYPLLASGGVLIIDDYGWWRGARQAADEYIHANNLKLLLNRIDISGARIAVKP